MDDSSLDEHVQWRLMMQYFKGNPVALLNALPSPRPDALKQQIKPVGEVVLRNEVATEQVPDYNPIESDA